MYTSYKKLITTIICLFIPICIGLSQWQSIVEKDFGRSIVPDIQLGGYDNEVVTIEGFVTRWEREEYRTTILYWLRNYWGDVVIVRTPDGHPEVNKAYRVTGTVSIGVFGEVDRQRYLDERRREVITDQQEVAQRVIANARQIINEIDEKWWLNASNAKMLLMDASRSLNTGDYQEAAIKAENAERSALEAPFSTLFYLVSAAGFILGVLIVTLIVMLVRKPSVDIEPQPASSSTPMPKSESVPEPSQIMSGETIKIHQPPPQTLKVLPGRFEVIAGDSEIKEIRLFKLPDQTDGEFTFGRNQGPPYRHIQIKHPTVSRDQAKLLFSNGKYTIVNRADPNKSNSTMINDKSMSINEFQELNDGDRITMGVVEMLYHDN